MVQNVARQNFPVHRARAYLEPGRMLLLPSAHEGQRNVMTLGWHMVMEFTPLLVACMISAGNHSFELVRESRRCVLNLPTEAMVDTVVGIGNCSGVEVDKFETFSITALAAQKVAASMIGECHASFECELAEDSLDDR